MAKTDEETGLLLGIPFELVSFKHLEVFESVITQQFMDAELQFLKC